MILPELSHGFWAQPTTCRQLAAMLRLMKLVPSVNLLDLGGAFQWLSPNAAQILLADCV